MLPINYYNYLIFFGLSKANNLVTFLALGCKILPTETLLPSIFASYIKN